MKLRTWQVRCACPFHKNGISVKVIVCCEQTPPNPHISHLAIVNCCIYHSSTHSFIQAMRCLCVMAACAVNEGSCAEGAHLQRR